MATGDLRLRPPALGSALVRDRDVHAFHVRPGGGTVHWAARLYHALSDSAARAGRAHDPVGPLGTDENGRIGRVAFRRLCGVRHDLPECADAAADHGEMD